VSVFSKGLTVHLIFDKRLVAFSPISLIGSLSMTLTFKITVTNRWW